VANVIELPEVSRYTDEVIQERNRLNVPFVANGSKRLLTALSTAQFTVERSHTNVTCVTRRFISVHVYIVTSASTLDLDKAHTHAMNARKVSHLSVPFGNTRTFIEVDTSAQNVANVIQLPKTSRNTGNVIQERNHLNAPFAANDS